VLTLEDSQIRHTSPSQEQSQTLTKQEFQLQKLSQSHTALIHPLMQIVTSAAWKLLFIAGETAQPAVVAMCNDCAL
jgi:hypothetical protein